MTSTARFDIKLMTVPGSGDFTDGVIGTAYYDTLRATSIELAVVASAIASSSQALATARLFQHVV